MIGDDGHALISSTGIQHDFAAAHGAVSRSCRWTAPEVLHPPEQEEEKPLSALMTPEADVYAFGMTVLEVIDAIL